MIVSNLSPLPSHPQLGYIRLTASIDKTGMITGFRVVEIERLTVNLMVGNLFYPVDFSTGASVIVGREITYNHFHRVIL